MGKLTARTVEGLCKAGLPGMTNDGDSLYLKIGKGGGASWIYRYRQAGKLRDMGLGAYPGVSLAEARTLAFEARRITQQGGDPISEKRAIAKAAEDEARRSVTFRELGDLYIQAHRAGWKSVKHAQQWGNTLEHYAYPLIGKLQLNRPHFPRHLKSLKLRSFRRCYEQAATLHGRIQTGRR
ncbi:tyrosine-type recombinase/integrase, partial [Aeromonas hydrophila]